MYGRGYVNNGVNIAANYLDSCFKAKGLESFESLKGYKQKCIYSANTFPGEMSLQINDSIFIPGVDFIIDAQSPARNGTYECVITTKWDLVNSSYKDVSGKVLIIDERKPSPLSKDELNKINYNLFNTTIHETSVVAIIELTNDKLTWEAAWYEGSCPYIRVNSLKTPAIPKTVKLNIEQKHIKKFKSYNICGYIKGSLNSDSLIVLTAHYDHLGMMGSKTLFPGANDNASGTTMLLSLIDYYSINKPKYDIVFIALTGEEIGLLGSQEFVESPPFDLKKIKFLINFDMAGTGDEGIQIVNSSIFKKQTEILTNINAETSLLPQIKLRGEACNSDHCPFYEKGVPSFFIYTLGGIKAYHDIYDIPKTLPLTKYNEYVKLMYLFIDKL